MEKVTADELLKKDLRGKIVCFPTDTVYGVGALYDDIEAINKIYDMKNRSRSKPLAILTPNSDVDKYVKCVSDDARCLMKEWPGALTIIYEKSDLIPDELVNGFKTVAFRMPNSKVALKILYHFGLMATTSVNVSGEAELNTVKDIEKEFNDYLDYLVVDEEVLTNHPSKIVDCSTNETKIIRRG